jgi:ferric enterobactin receptor
MKGKKLTTLLLVFAAVLWSQVFHAQLEQLISGDFTNTNATKVLRQLKREYDLRFSFEPEAMDSLEVDLQFESTPLSEVLEKVFDQTDYTFELIGKTIVIYYIEPLMPELLPTRSFFTWRGQIRDKRTGEPLPFANIRAVGTSTVTDDQGKFVLRNLPSDTSTVIINYVGYAEVQVKLNPEIIDKEKSIQLEQNRVLLPSAVVVGRRLPLLETTDIVSTQAMNPLDLSLISGNGEPDAMRAAQLLPGVAATLENSSGLVIRGNSADQSLVSFDGFTIYHLDHFYGIFSAFNANAIKNMRIHKGGMNASFGGRSGGWVEITGKEGNRYAPKFQLDLSMLSLGFLFESPIAKSQKASILVAFRRSYTDQIFTPLFQTLFNTSYNSSIAVVDDNASSEVDIFSRETEPEFRFYDLIAKMNLNPHPEHNVQVSAFRGRDKLGFVYYLSSDQGRYDYAYNDDNSWGSDGLGVRWRWTKEDFRLRTSAGYSRYVSNLFSTDTVTDQLFGFQEISRGEFENALLDGRVQTEAAFILGKHDLHVGLQANDISSIRGSLGNSDRFEEINQSSNEATFYVFENWEVYKGLRITPGLRTTYYRQKTNGEANSHDYWIEPRFSLSFKTGKTGNIKFGSGRYYQTIHRVRSQSLLLNSPDLWAMSDGRTIPFVFSDHLIGGYTWKKNSWTVDAELFYHKHMRSFENLTSYYFLSGGIDLGKDSIIVGKGFSRGLELLIQRDMKGSHLSVSYTLQEALGNFGQFQETFHRSNDQRHEFKAFFEMKRLRWEWSAYFVFGSGRPYTPLLGSYEVQLIDGSSRTMPLYGEINSARLPVYHRADISAAWLFEWGKSKGKISANIYNVYNRQNIRDIQYYSISDSGNEVIFVERRVRMLGILPGLNLQLTF